jgi:hypothetical protein
VCAGDRFAHREAPGRRDVVRVATAQSVDGTLDHWPGRLQVWVADTQDDDVFAALARGDGLVVSEPGDSTLAADTLDQC